jgi:hypothetical protein
VFSNDLLKKHSEYSKELNQYIEDAKTKQKTSERIGFVKESVI